MEFDYLEVEDDGPDKSKNHSRASIHNIGSIDVDQFDLVGKMLRP